MHNEEKVEVLMFTSARVGSEKAEKSRSPRGQQLVDRHPAMLMRVQMVVASPLVQAFQDIPIVVN